MILNLSPFASLQATVFKFKFCFHFRAYYLSIQKHQVMVNMNLNLFCNELTLREFLKPNEFHLLGLFISPTKVSRTRISNNQNSRTKISNCITLIHPFCPLPVPFLFPVCFFLTHTHARALPKTHTCHI